MADYIEHSKANPENLKPRVRLYLENESNLYVAWVGIDNDWTVYKGNPNMGLSWVANYGVKIDEETAKELFPICVEAGLEYRN